MQTKGYTLEQLGAVFGDAVVDDEGHAPAECEKQGAFESDEKTSEAVIETA
jgi:hypothetical protein